jgi:uncharacterized membrane protein (UPF0127 family)
MRRILLTALLIMAFFVTAIIFLIVTNRPFETKTAKVFVGRGVFEVEIADNPVLHQRGLSGRSVLGENEGMLFIFPQPGFQNFWMKDMKFPIDIIWIRDHKVIGMVIGAEPAFAEASAGKPESYTIYTSPEPVDMVLEINAGKSQQFGIKIGDGVTVQ